MVTQITVTGMVLAAMPVGDYDKRLVILTKERGKVAVFAKGARRPNSALIACSQPFTFGVFYLYVGKNSYNVTSAEISNYFTEVREDIETVSYGCYFCELAEQVTRENNDEVQMLKLLYQTMRALTKQSIPNMLIRYIFELKAMCVNGYSPQVFECTGCGHEENIFWFSLEAGGMICDNCREGKHGLMKLSGSTIYTLQFILTTPIEGLYTFTVNEQVLKELKALMKGYLTIMVTGPFKSLEVLETLY